MSLTPQEQKALMFLQGYLAANDYPPSVREVASALGYRTSSAADYVLRKLERKGYITRELFAGRALRLLRPIVAVY